MKIEDTKATRIWGSVLFGLLTICLLSCLFLFPSANQGTLSIAQGLEDTRGKTIEVVSNADKLQVLSANIDDERFVVTVKNNYDKGINSFYLTTGKITYHIELLYSDLRDNVVPSSEYQMVTELDKSLYNSGLTIRAVLFDDGTGVGDARYVIEMQGKREGERIQLERGVQLFDDVLNTPKSGLSDGVMELRKKISRLPLTNGKVLDESIKFGMDLGRQRLLEYCEDLSAAAKNNDWDRFETETSLIRTKLARYISKLN